VELAGPIIILAVILAAVALFLRRQRPEAPGAEGEARRGRSRKPPEPEEIDVVHPRPPVAEMHVVGEEARVRFSVPVPDDPDPVLAELLVSEAVEVVREKRHTLPMSDVTAVVALAGSAENPTTMGKASLATPGELPPPTAGASMLNLTSIATDPLERSFLDHAHDAEAKPEMHVETVARVPEDALEPVGSLVKLPKAVDLGLRAQGIDPAKMSAGQLVTGMLGLVGYQVNPGLADGTCTAVKAGSTTFIREDRYSPGDHPEISQEDLRRFLFEFQASGADRGMYVSEKYGPFEVYDMERREPRIRFITRERLQKFVEAVSLG
jgi:hypothetical protein